MTSQDILNVLLVAVLLLAAGCIVYITYYLAQALRSITKLTDSLENTSQQIKDKIQVKALAAIPALLIAIMSRLLRRR